MKRGYIFALVLILAFGFANMVIAQTWGIIDVKGIPDRFKSTNGGNRTTGLKTVGVYEKVVLEAKAIKGSATVTVPTHRSVTIDSMISAVWTISGPKGPIVPDDFVAGNNHTTVTFRPDTIGEFTVQMTATSKSGTSAAVTIKIVAAKFVGAGISINATGVPSTCSCHGSNPAVFTSWQKTKHATAVKNRMDDPLGHFSVNCMSCHAVSYVDTLNGGYQILAKQQGFSIPANHVGLWDSLVTAKPSIMAMTGIQCENCHGPAGEHVKAPVPGNNKVDVTTSSEVCAPCHFSGDRHGIGYAWTASLHSVAQNNGSATSVQSFNRFMCAKCHTGQGYVNEFVKGNPEPIPVTDNIVYANDHSITCQTCHDPHNNTNPLQLRAKSVADACMDCHSVRLSTTGIHAAHQGSMLIGAEGVPFNFEIGNNYLKTYKAAPNTNQLINVTIGRWTGWQYPGYKYENSSHSDMEERCVTCHMAQSPSYDPTYAKPDSMLNKLGGHTFKVAYTDATTGVTTLNPKGCVECHGATTIEFVELTQAKTAAMLSELYTLLPKRDTTKTTTAPLGTVSAWSDTFNNAVRGPDKRLLTMAEKAAAFNYAFVNNEGSGGVHNFKYTEQLLKSSIEQLKLVAGAANIVAPIADVPGDNGKKIQIVWNQFPAEKMAFGRVTKYVVYRMDPFPIGSGVTKKVNTYTEMLENAGPVGDQFSINGIVWTEVAMVNATNLAQYGAIVPTLFDSTKTKGMYWTKFMVAGLNDDNSVKYSSPIDSGYSLNNVLPTAVANFAASFSAGKVNLKWDAPAPVDDDIVKYVLYRGTDPNFVPSTPLADNLTGLVFSDPNVQNGVTYTYKITAVDNAGNQSPYVSVTLKVMSVTDLGKGIPTEFALGQNYPNPFNPSTEISFALPKDAQVNITIYSISGNEVRNLMNDRMTAGYWGITWNGTDNNGASVSSGVYLYRIKAGDFVATKKMILLK